MTTPSQLATILQQNPCSIALDNHYGGHDFSRSLLVLSDMDGTNMEIAQAKEIVKLRLNAAERKYCGKTRRYSIV